MVRAGGASEFREGPGGLEVSSLPVWRLGSKVKLSAGQVLWGPTGRILPGLLQRPGAHSRAGKLHPFSASPCVCLPCVQSILASRFRAHPGLG